MSITEPAAERQAPIPCSVLRQLPLTLSQLLKACEPVSSDRVRSHLRYLADLGWLEFSQGAYRLTPHGLAVLPLSVPGVEGIGVGGSARSSTIPPAIGSPPAKPSQADSLGEPDILRTDTESGSVNAKSAKHPQGGRRPDFGLTGSDSVSPSAAPTASRAGHAESPEASAGPLEGGADGSRSDFLSRYYEEKEAGIVPAGVYGDSYSAACRRLGRFHKARVRMDPTIMWLVEQSNSHQYSPARRDAFRDLAYDLSTCADILTFREYLDGGTLPYRLVGGIFCQKFRMCQVCAIRRATKLLRHYAPIIEDVIAREQYVPYMVTFTQSGCDCLPEAFQTLTGTLTRIQKDAKRWQEGAVQTRQPFGLFAGAVFCIEVKRGEGTRGGGWHVHTHGIALANRELSGEDIEDIKDHWCLRNGHADPRGQDVQLLRSYRELVATGGMAEQDQEELIAGDTVASDLVEVFKYPLKWSTLSPEDRYQAFQDLTRRHMVRPWGVLRGAEPVLSYLDAPLDAEDIPYVDHFLQFMGKGYKTRSTRSVTPVSITD